MKSLLLIVSLLFSLLGSAAAFSAENGLVDQSAVLGTGSLVQMLAALGVVVVLIFGLSIALRRFNMFSSSSSAHIRIMGGLALSNKERLLLIQVGEEQLLISASPGRIQKIHEMQSPIDFTEAADNKGVSGQSFSNMLQNLTQRGRS